MTQGKTGQAEALAQSAADAFVQTSAMPSYSRAQILAKIAAAIESKSEAFARLITEEVRKPIKESRREVARAVFTFKWASEEAKRFGGELLPLDLDEASRGRQALTRRAPSGPALFITPFNFPLNLVAHKVAPAVAVGAPFVLKPAPHAPKTAAKLVDIIIGAGWPKDAAGLAVVDNEDAEALARDERFSVLSFTGSAKVGWHLKSCAGKKRVLLELGGNAAVYVDAGADVAWAAARCAWGAFYYSGQVCISVQRIYAEESIYDKFKDLLLQNTAELKLGDPADEKIDVGPLISEDAAKRVEDWISEAAAGGGKILCGGKRRGDVIEPTIVENAPASCRLSCEEAFGPVAVLEKVETKIHALDKLCEGRYGLQAGIFTNDLAFVFEAWQRVPVGGLVVNDIPAFRSDAMPYGGIRDSGTGREGVRYAMEEMTELRTLVLKP
ncbi:MAG: aldehyde dehydrogenase family protein [Elusimicrobia bacterium]|nr:aldehyde dehydrogenase family protein [Elusimicrobiota bacterium]